MNHEFKRLLLPAAALALTACSDVPITPSSPRPPAHPKFPITQHTGEPIDVPAVVMDVPEAARPWDTSDSALSAAIAAEDGHAVIGFKEMASPRVLEADGHRAAVTAGTIRGALAMLRGHGVEVIELFDAIGAAHVKMDPALAGELRHHPLVDYIEPRRYRKIQGVRGDFSATVALNAMLTQTRPWALTWSVHPPPGR